MWVVRKPFEILEHPADVEFLAYGGTLAELFENAGLVLCSLACAPEKFDRARHAAGTYIKAVTLHQIAVERAADGFCARIS